MSVIDEEYKWLVDMVTVKINEKFCNMILVSGWIKVLEVAEANVSIYNTKKC